MQVIGSTSTEPLVEAVVSRSWDPSVAAWLRRGLTRRLRRDPALLRSVRGLPELREQTKRDGLSSDVVARIEASFVAGDPVLVPNVSAVTAFLAKASDMLDWLTSLPEGSRHRQRLDRVSIEEAMVLSDDWHARLAERIEFSGVANEGARIDRVWDDGVRMVELRSPSALKREGSAMGHCVGGYWENVSKGLCRIFSLRDADDGSHVTVEIGRVPSVQIDGEGVVPLARIPMLPVEAVPVATNSHVVRQVKGRANLPPSPRWAGYVLEHLREKGWSGEVGTDGREIVVYTVDGKHYASAEVAVSQVLKDVGRSAHRRRSTLQTLPSGLVEVASYLGEEGRRRYDARMRAIARIRDAGVAERSVLLSVGSRTLEAVSHPLPVGTMELLAAGSASEELFVSLQGRLAAVLDMVEADPRSVHVASLPVGCGVSYQTASDMFLLAGLASRREEVREKARVGQTAALRDMRESLRLEVQARRSGRGGTGLSTERVNFLANVLRGDGLEPIDTLVSARLGPVRLLLPVEKAKTPTPSLERRQSTPATSRTARRLLEIGRR